MTPSKLVKKLNVPRGLNRPSRSKTAEFEDWKPEHVHKNPSFVHMLGGLRLLDKKTNLIFAAILSMAIGLSAVLVYYDNKEKARIEATRFEVMGTIEKIKTVYESGLLTSMKSTYITISGIDYEISNDWMEDIKKGDIVKASGTEGYIEVIELENE